MKDCCLATALVLIASLGACALSAPPAAETLRADPRRNPADAQSELDQLAEVAERAAEAAPDDAAAQVAAAARLFQAADLRLQRATVDWLAKHPEASRKQVLGAEDQVDEAVRQQILSLCTAGLLRTERAVALAPDQVAGVLHQSLHLSLIAWANGPARSLLAGHGPRLVAAIDRALTLDRDFDHGAPLRLQGRFRSKAPWPYGDLAVAQQALARAVELAPIPVNHLFYGDALAAAGDAERAAVQWRLVEGAVADESTRWSADALRELARRRLAAKP